MKYIRVISEPMCCVPSCIKMILLRHKLRQLTQEKIGYELGLQVLPRQEDIFNKVRVIKSPDDLIGTQLHKDENLLNQFFKKYNYPFIHEYHYLEDVNLIRYFLQKNKKHDIMVCFEMAGIYKPFYSSDIVEGGHVVLVENFEDDELILIDGWFDPCKKISLEDISEAIKKHGKRNAAGFWLIKKINEEETK